MEKVIKKVITMMVVLILTAALSLCAFADDYDPDKNGSLTISFADIISKQPGENIEADIFRVADIYYEDGELMYELLEEFSDVIESDNGIEFAANLYRTATLKNVSGMKIFSNSEGYIVVDNCDKGLYLIVSPDENFEPFLVSIPQYEDGIMIYDVKAKPKTEITPETTTENSSNTTKKNDQNGKTEQHTNPDSTLPRTGMVQWPIPILAFCGAIIFAIGYIVNEREKRKEKKK